MKSIIVVAIGCRFMKDDGIGIRVAEVIKDDLAKNDIKAVIAETDSEYALEGVKEYDYVIILDAMISDKLPGEITTIPLTKTDIPDRMSQHEMSLCDMISKVEKKDGYLIGIEACEIGIGLELSKPLQNNFLKICEQVQRKILSIKENIRDA